MPRSPFERLSSMTILPGAIRRKRGTGRGGGGARRRQEAATRDRGHVHRGGALLLRGARGRGFHSSTFWLHLSTHGRMRWVASRL